MTIETTMTIRELDLSYAALITLSPDSPEANDMIYAMADRVQSAIKEIDPDYGPNSDMDDPMTVTLDADENEWAALADGLQMLDPGDDDLTTMSLALSERVRSLNDDPFPGM